MKPKLLTRLRALDALLGAVRGRRLLARSQTGQSQLGCGSESFGNVFKNISESEIPVVTITRSEPPNLSEANDFLAVQLCLSGPGTGGLGGCPGPPASHLRRRTFPV